MASPRSVMAQVQPIGYQDIHKFAIDFRGAAFKFRAAVARVQPEFGAYMKYSIYQELGTLKNHPPPRPHILPSVLNSSGVILAGLNSFLLDFLNKNIGVRKSANAYDKAYETAWLRVLNGPVRIAAVESARSQGVWQYGFHVRSIHGYTSPRSPGEIQAVQDEATAARGAKARGKK